MNDDIENKSPDDIFEYDQFISRGMHVDGIRKKLIKLFSVRDKAIDSLIQMQFDKKLNENEFFCLKKIIREASDQDDEFWRSYGIDRKSEEWGIYFGERIKNLESCKDYAEL